MSKDKVKKHRETLGFQPADHPWTDRKLLHGVPRAPYVIELMDIAWASRCRSLGFDVYALTPEQENQASTDFWLNITQSLDRKPWFAGRRRTSTTSTIVYSFQHDRLLCPVEYLMQHGLPSSDVVQLRGLEPKDVYDLSGEAFALPSISSFLFAMLSSASCGVFEEADPSCPSMAVPAESSSVQ